MNSDAGDERRPAGSGVNVCAEFLSIYVDEQMKKLFRDLPDAEVEARLNKVITLFRFLRDKDVFEAYYKQHLTVRARGSDTTVRDVLLPHLRRSVDVQKRLLGNRTSNEDFERLMLSKMKTECGFQYTSKLEGMFNDLKTSADLMVAFRREFRGADEAAGAASPSPCELDVSVLTSGFWPVVSDPPCALPPPVKAAAARFEAFYLAKHSGRRLRWNTVKGSAELRATFGSPAAPRRHELSVSSYQMCVLVLFNDAEELTFGSIQAALGVPGAGELRRHVVSLLNPKCRILEMRSRGAGGGASGPSGLLDLDDSDVLAVHADFSSKMVKVKVPLSERSARRGEWVGDARGAARAFDCDIALPTPPLALTVSAKSAIVAAGGGKGGTAGVPAAGAADGDGRDVPGQVEETRKHLLEAAIVRTMKTRKTMGES